ncbi:MAG: serine hydrolase [Deltaproteobacteria bacterium]|nr:serine hydrolase [Deltaproteobacteria bacterium]
MLLAAKGERIAANITAGRLEYGDQASSVHWETIYDLASLTKILSTTILTMIFLDQGRFDLQSPLKRLWPFFVPDDKKELTLFHLLSHTSGLPAWRPYFETLEQVPSEERRKQAAELILEEPFEAEPGTRSIYSDLNFILLGLILEEIGHARLDRLFDEHIARPLTLRQTGYRPLDQTGLSSTEEIAPTEDCPDRGGVLKGAVHDKNAYALSGAAGHAGLFGTAGEVWRIMASLRASFRNDPGNHLVSTQTVKTFWKWTNDNPHITGALGFDRPAETDSAAGRYFSRASVGHLGFTGTSVWYDPDMDLTVILLTNRVHPSSANEAIKEFRPSIHDLAFKTIIGKNFK